jgi:ATP-dependent DNA helicase RecG
MKKQIMTELELKQYIQQHFPKENESCEWKGFKSLKHSFGGQSGHDIISYISAIANMEGGHLVVGIRDKTLDITGIEEFNNYTTQNIKLKIIEKCANISSEGLAIEEFTTSDTHKKVWIFHIPKHLPRLIVYAHSKAWQRIEDSLVELKKARQDIILNEPMGKTDDWSAQIIATATINDLDPKAIVKAREEYKEKNPKRAIESEAWDDITLLNKAKVTIQGEITNTAILLLGKEESGHFINPAVAKIS